MFEEPEGATLVELGRDRTSAYFALISREAVEIDADVVMPNPAG